MTTTPEWIPIDDYARSGKPVLVCRDRVYARPMLAVYVPRNNRWEELHGDWDNWEDGTPDSPTHYIPLPLYLPNGESFE